MNRSSDRDEASVLIQKHPPLSVFLEEPFETDIVVEGDCMHNKFDILASLVEENSLNRVMVNLVVLQNPSPLELGVSGTLRCSITTIAETQLFFERNPIFRLHISALFVTTTDKGPSIVTATAISSKILVVKYKILVSPSVDWSNVWYKDEGGRDKCMEVMAGVYDHQRALLYDAVPLLLTLCYCSSNKRYAPPIPVTNQDILRILGPKSNELSIDKTTGTIKIKFRVEDVSKNHQGQDFCVQLTVADSREGSRRIAPGLTPPITIRSKRNKRGRPSTSTPVSTTGVYSEHKIQHSVTSADQSGLTQVCDSPDAMQLRDAVRGVAQWVDDVVSGLYSLQWQVVGYSRDANGNQDYSRPYHNMQNPNALIARVLTMYNESICDQLHLLQQAVGAQAPQPLSSLRYYPETVASLPPSFDPRYGMMPPGYVLPPLRDNYIGGSGFSAPYQQGYYSSQDREQMMVTSSSSRANPERESQRTTLAVARRSHETSKPSPIRKTDGGRTATVASFEQLPSNDVVVHDASPDDGTRESEVEYILAKQFKSIRTGERLGFPAYSVNKELLGFYQTPSNKVGPGVFVPLSESDFGPAERLHARKILEQADEESVHSLKEWGSVLNMLNRALVYEWSQGLAVKTKKL